MAKQEIILDCPPGEPRPGDLIEGVIEGTELECRNTVLRCYGMWVWDYSDIPSEHWKKIEPVLGKRINDLYYARIIRGGKW